METNYEKNGIYLSRDYYNWLLEKNEELTDRHATFGELFKAFSNSRYRRFIQEQNLMGNEFFYHIKKIDDSIRLERSYDLVFAPYDMILTGSDVKTDIETTNDFVASYSILCPGGRFPTKSMNLNYCYYSRYQYDDCISFDPFTKERERYEKNMGMQSFENTLKLSFIEFAMDEENVERFIKVNFEHLLARRIEANVIRHLMEDAESLYLVNRRHKYYELRLLAFAEAIMLLSTHKYEVGKRIPLMEIKEYAKKRLNDLEEQSGHINIDLTEMSKEIRETRKNIINFRVSDKLNDDCEEDYDMWEFFDCEEEEVDEFFLKEDIS
ncbi:hypothetical protein D6855_05400 [Butyrivibrio sp. CB08]|uniref:hypothetical protein n=1 Tax=Butyrivibrio sp. CB08 TaxID=2364879 RepID=UPI000EA91C87|nr:hypothetical protein [Butyrivibrio sp. CB08]RKM61327.1 hypothetical protein D6855_05400 [Butyrivibrio sp. CB08]